LSTKSDTKSESSHSAHTAPDAPDLPTPVPSRLSPAPPRCIGLVHCFDVADRTHCYYHTRDQSWFNCQPQPCSEAYKLSVPYPIFLSNNDRQLFIIPTRNPVPRPPSPQTPQRFPTPEFLRSPPPEPMTMTGTTTMSLEQRMASLETLLTQTAQNITNLTDTVNSLRNAPAPPPPTNPPGGPPGGGGGDPSEPGSGGSGGPGSPRCPPCSRSHSTARDSDDSYTSSKLPHAKASPPPVRGHTVGISGNCFPLSLHPPISPLRYPFLTSLFSSSFIPHIYHSLPCISSLYRVIRYLSHL
jgi:hypothetical protein